MSATAPDSSNPRSSTSDLATRVAVLERIARGTEAALERIERRFDRSDDHAEARAREHHADNAQTNNRIDQTNNRIDQTNDRIDKMFWLMLGGFGSLLGTIAHGFRWI